MSMCISTAQARTIWAPWFWSVLGLMHFQQCDFISFAQPSGHFVRVESLSLCHGAVFSSFSIILVKRFSEFFAFLCYAALILYEIVYDLVSSLSKCFSILLSAILVTRSCAFICPLGCPHMKTSTHAFQMMNEHAKAALRRSCGSAAKQWLMCVLCSRQSCEKS